jgi:hypothetical protein
MFIPFFNRKILGSICRKSIIRPIYCITAYYDSRDNKLSTMVEALSHGKHYLYTYISGKTKEIKTSNALTISNL